MSGECSFYGKGETGKVQKTLRNLLVNANSSTWEYVSYLIEGTLMDMRYDDRLRMIPIAAETLGREAQIAANTTSLQLEQEGRLKTNNSASSSSNSAETRVERTESGRRWKERKWEKETVKSRKRRRRK